MLRKTFWPRGGILEPAGREQLPPCFSGALHPWTSVRCPDIMAVLCCPTSASHTGTMLSINLLLAWTFLNDFFTFQNKAPLTMCKFIQSSYLIRTSLKRHLKVSFLNRLCDGPPTFWPLDLRETQMQTPRAPETSKRVKNDDVIERRRLRCLHVDLLLFWIPRLLRNI